MMEACMSAEVLRTSMTTPTTWSPIVLNRNECLSLHKITSSFSAPITEEHAWAIIFECSQTLERLLVSDAKLKIHLVTHTNQIFIHKDGRVHESSFLEPGKQGGSTSLRQSTSSEAKVIAELGLVIYTALDYGMKKNEERQLTPGLANLLDLMTSADEDLDDRTETDDEGIEQDHEDQLSTSPKRSHQRRRTETVRRVIHLCQNHLSVGSEAESHYRAVCRALVSESLELTKFMERVSSQSREHSEELRELDIRDWAALWIQVMCHLRQGVKLKKTDYTKTPIEYELTPYEMLMDDIRSRRYKLNKVVVNGEIPPKIKKDAHDMILEFIRSRPPLRPVSQRQLPPSRRYSTPQELLMMEIRSGTRKASLRKTPGPPQRQLMIERSPSGPLLVTPEARQLQHQSGQPSTHSPNSELPSFAATPSPTTNNPKRIIRPDPKLLDFDSDGEDDDEVFPVTNDEKPVPRPVPAIRVSTGSPKKSIRWQQTIALDLATSAPVSPPNRRHTLTVCQTESPAVSPTVQLRRKHNVFAPSSQTPSHSQSHIFSRTPSLPFTRPNSFCCPTIPEHASTNPISLSPDNLSPISVPLDRAPDRPLTPNRTPLLVSGMTRTARRMSGNGKLTTSNDHFTHNSYTFKTEKFDRWTAALKTLDLNLEEVAHIRSVLAKAELEGLSVASALKEDLEKGKVCFLCMKTRFGLFSWGYTCKLCQHAVCHGCLRKMKIPTEHFSKIPVFALTPANLGSDFDESSDRRRSLKFPLDDLPNSLGSSPPSPEVERKDVRSISGGIGSPNSMVLTSTPRNESKVKLRRSSTMSRFDRQKQLSGGSQVNVCLDCRDMILHIIRAQRATRRQQFTRSLVLT